MQRLTVKQFNVWLASNDYNQTSLALAMGINKQTITTYKNNDRFPRIFELALKGLSSDSSVLKTENTDVIFSNHKNHDRVNIEHQNYDCEINIHKKTIEIYYLNIKNQRTIGTINII
ncbi:MAG: hypothetical protein GY928_20890 [Colwellia sp.]|nr:hypothetical protein [Colwellia sp.]